jgi:hypothetical protein
VQIYHISCITSKGWEAIVKKPQVLPPIWAAPHTSPTLLANAFNTYVVPAAERCFNFTEVQLENWKKKTIVGEYHPEEAKICGIELCPPPILNPACNVETASQKKRAKKRQKHELQ